MICLAQRRLDPRPLGRSFTGAWLRVPERGPIEYCQCPTCRAADHASATEAIARQIEHVTTSFQETSQ